MIYYFRMCGSPLMPLRMLKALLFLKFKVPTIASNFKILSNSETLIQTSLLVIFKEKIEKGQFSDRRLYWPLTKWRNSEKGKI